MRTFEHFPQDNKPCPVCGTRDDKETVLVPIAGTSDGSIAQALCVHADCVMESIVYYPEHRMIISNTKE